MPLKINQVPYMEGAENGDVHPDEDALMYHEMLRSNYFVRPVSAASLGGNLVALGGGYALVYGHQIIISDETLAIPLHPPGPILGRTVIEIDTANTEVPIKWVHQLGNPLPPLVQEDLVNGGTVYQLPVLTYNVSEVVVSDVAVVAGGKAFLDVVHEAGSERHQSNYIG